MAATGDRGDVWKVRTASSLDCGYPHRELGSSGSASALGVRKGHVGSGDACADCPNIPYGGGSDTASSKAVLWDLDPHTIAKHRLLRAYLDRWLPIMSTYQDRLLIVDGFAGPGRYVGGEDGSPVIMLKAYLEHAQRARIGETHLDYFFVERDGRRFDYLLGEIERLRPLPGNVSVFPVHAEYGTTMDGIVGDAANRVPTFAFIDPFGYADARFELTSKILGFPRCEVLIFLPTPYLNRFLAKPDLAVTFDLLYGGREWAQALEVDADQRPAMLRDLFTAALRRDADFVRSFEIVTDAGRGYHLFFATKHPKGLEKWKEAAWSVDPVDGREYRERRPTDQMTLFDLVPGSGAPLKFEPNTAPLLAALRDRFGSTPFTIEEAAEFTDVHTAFLSTSHLRQRTLLQAEKAGALRVLFRSKAGFPPRTSMVFVHP